MTAGVPTQPAEIRIAHGKHFAMCVAVDECPSISERASSSPDRSVGAARRRTIPDDRRFRAAERRSWRIGRDVTTPARQTAGALGLPELRVVPHMTWPNNTRRACKRKHVPRDETARRNEEALELVHRRPTEAKAHQMRGPACRVGSPGPRQNGPSEPLDEPLGDLALKLRKKPPGSKLSGSRPRSGSRR